MPVKVLPQTWGQSIFSFFHHYSYPQISISLNSRPLHFIIKWNYILGNCTNFYCSPHVCVVSCKSLYYVSKWCWVRIPCSSVLNWFMVISVSMLISYLQKKKSLSCELLIFNFSISISINDVWLPSQLEDNSHPC